MDRREALGVLGLDDSADPAAVRAAFRARIAVAHPDVAGADATAVAARLTQAYAVLQRVPADAPGDASPMPDRPPPPPPPPVTWTDDEVDATLRLDAVGPEAFALLEEAAAQVGYISYIDRHLHLLEIVVRFDGGPSCSVVMSMQGRATHTEIFVTMASIEAAPTPPIDAVVEALAAAIEP